MNNIVANFEEIFRFAKNYGLPPEKKRAIVREYLQTKILSFVYQEKISKNLFFVGGTALRILRGLDRFSEDLDFDAVKIKNTQIKELILTVVGRLERENINTELYQNVTPKKSFYELRFPNLLAKLQLSPNTSEKLMVKLDIESFWQGQKRETIFVNRYGFLATVVTKSLEQVAVEKLVAYLVRKETQPRDLYDLVWLLSRGIKPDLNFAKENHLPADLLGKAQKKFILEQKFLARYKTKLRPFLFDERQVNRLDFFEELIRQVQSPACRQAGKSSVRTYRFGQKDREADCRNGKK
ncbi:MAG: nucleotidyl transferase AbiEii/AbiGii toxin family protein [Candidatus Gottesmanbacteria bacterium]|nr:nucleotidyl transferase AbiEii/AbiGii toxin family protein [Candidatus Nealsonbacteria bacterium]MCX6793892.1 nucleotidyl transferase AbiEii/AbiGii toxin family protein [Candidatus Gottesmanbacteria bacterium]